jgi:hypothetical protein
MRFVRSILVLALIAGAAAPLAAEDTKLAALFIMSFTKYVEWPAASDSTCVITVLGDDPIYDQLKSLATAGQVEGRTVVVNKAMRIENIAKTHILYVAPDKSNQLGTVAAKFSSEPTLVVTQKPGLAKEGAGINIITVEGKLSFEVNAESLKHAGLGAKPLLFKLGKLVN